MSNRSGVQWNFYLQSDHFESFTKIAPQLLVFGIMIDIESSSATFKQPRTFPEGIKWVIVNGEIVARSGELTGARSGCYFNV